MSWMAIQQTSRLNAVTGDAIVTMSVSKPGRLVQRIYLTVNPRLLPEGKLSWWTYSRPVNVELGQGEHAGRLRLTDQGQFRIMAPTGRRAKEKPNSPTLQISGVPGMPPEGLGRHTVAWEIAGDALIVTLPWSDAKGMAKADPAPRAVGAPSSALPVPAPAAPRPQTPTATATALPAKPGATLAAVELPYAEIQQWAIAHGVGTATHGFDLAQVNGLRFEAGQRPFKIRKSQHGAS